MLECPYPPCTVSHSALFDISFLQQLSRCRTASRQWMGQGLPSCLRSASTVVCQALGLLFRGGSALDGKSPWIWLRMLGWWFPVDVLLNPSNHKISQTTTMTIIHKIHRNWKDIKTQRNSFPRSLLPFLEISYWVLCRHGGQAYPTWALSGWSQAAPFERQAAFPRFSPGGLDGAAWSRPEDLGIIQ